MSVQTAKKPSSLSRTSGSGETVTWNHLKFWTSKKWQEIQKILSSHREFVTPPMKMIFRPFIETPLSKVKVVFLFPEPYYTEGLADGLALSYKGEKAPYLFEAFMSELKKDYSVRAKRTDLKNWARRGVLLWNARLTTLKGHSRGHAGLGWEVLTREVLETVYLVNPEAVFVFVGSEVQNKYHGVLPEDAKVLLVNLPLPKVFQDRPDGFEGCRLFSQINKMLGTSWKKRILWET